MNDIGLSVQFDHFYRESGMIKYIGKEFSEADIKLLDKLSNKDFWKPPKTINRYELAYVMQYANINYRYFDIGHERQKQFVYLLNNADKIKEDYNPDNFKIYWRGKELPGMSEYNRWIFDLWGDDNKMLFDMKDNYLNVFREYFQTIVKIADYLKDNPYSVYLREERNSPIKTITKEIYSFLQDRFKLGTTQSFYAIGYIYAHYGICLKDPILTEEQWDADQMNQNDTTYRDYLKGKIQTFLK